MNTNIPHLVVDKTMMIQEYLQREDPISCITRPSDFGKTSNLQMLSTFLDITKDVTDQFQTSSIAQTPNWQQRNQYPVLFLSFQAAKCHSLELCLYYIKKAILQELERHQSILGRTLQASTYIKNMKKDTNALDALVSLSEELYAIYQRPVHILLDDYDLPLRYAKRYDFEHALRKNFNYLPLIERTSESPIASVLLLGTECLFKGNEVKTYTCMDDGYTSAFGYTEEEVETLFRQANLPWSSKIKEMYGGFVIGNQSIYQPYAIGAYVTSGKYIIHTNYRSTSKRLLESLKTEDKAILLSLQALEKANSIRIPFHTLTKPTSFWTQMVNAGYITIHKQNKKTCSVRITNKETEVEIQYMIKKLKETE